jgi:uncharacterized protein YndB with AHSA1/START domain
MSDIRHRLTIKAPPSDVFAALTTLEGIADWWTVDVAGDPGPDGRFQVSFGRPADAWLSVVHCEQDALVEWESQPLDGNDPPHSIWHGTHVAFELKRTKAGSTTMDLRHTGWAEFDDGVAFCNTTWARLMRRLRQALEAGGGPSRERYEGAAR